MTVQSHLDPYTSPKTFYGSELRRLREEQGLSQERLGERVFCSGAYIGQFESATRRPQPDVSRLFDEVFGTGEHFRRLCHLARTSKHAEYFADAAELEKLASTISEYAPMLVPGLLQTEGYARALTRTTLPSAPEEEIEGHVRTRMERALLLNLRNARLVGADPRSSITPTPETIRRGRCEIFPAVSLSSWARLYDSNRAHGHRK